MSLEKVNGREEFQTLQILAETPQELLILAPQESTYRGRVWVKISDKNEAILLFIGVGCAALACTGILAANFTNEKDAKKIYIASLISAGGGIIIFGRALGKLLCSLRND